MRYRVLGKLTSTVFAVHEFIISFCKDETLVWRAADHYLGEYTATQATVVLTGEQFKLLEKGLQILGITSHHNPTHYTSFITIIVTAVDVVVTLSISNYSSYWK